MKVIADLQQDALDLARREAQLRNVELGDVISEAILACYCERPMGDSSKRYDLPVSGAGGLQPGVGLDSWAALEERMDYRLRESQ